MKAVFFTFLFAAIVVVQCTHRFVGTNVNRTQVHHEKVEKDSKLFRKTIDNFYYRLPSVRNVQRSIQGILALDLAGSRSQASANITQGGIGYNFVNIRMKSERGSKLSFDIFIFA